MEKEISRLEVSLPNLVSGYSCERDMMDHRFLLGILESCSDWAGSRYWMNLCSTNRSMTVSGTITAENEADSCLTTLFLVRGGPMDIENVRMALQHLERRRDKKKCAK